MMKKYSAYLFLLMPFVSVLGGCDAIPKGALSMNATTLEDRQLQTRIFDTSDEAAILSASASLLQDLGFNLDESETELGLLVASKDRSATEVGQVIMAFAMAALTGSTMPIDSKQKIRTSLVTSPVGETEERTTVRVTFQRTVWDTYGDISKLQKLDDPKMYQEFFEKLSKAVFLEAHSI